MKRKYLYLPAVLLVTTSIACTNDVETSAEGLAKEFCDCNKIENADKRESCIDNVSYRLQFHLNDSEFMTAYNRASQACHY